MKYKTNILVVLFARCCASLIPSICHEFPPSFINIGLTESISNRYQGAHTTCGVIDISTKLAGPFMPASYTTTFSLDHHEQEHHDEIESEASNEKDHGLRVATILAGQRPPIKNFAHGFIGVAPQTHIISYDGSSLSGFQDALLHTDIFCINISLSMETDQGISYITEHFIPEAYKKNIILVFSASNDGVPLTRSTYHGISWPEALCEAASQYPNVIIAGGVTHIDENNFWRLSGSSNFISKYEPFPRYAFITAPSTYGIDDPTKKNIRHIFHGTSYSAPLISGALCLLKEMFPAFNNITLAALLMLSGSTFQSIRHPQYKEINIQEYLTVAHNILTLFHIHDSEKSAASCRNKQEYLHSNIPLNHRLLNINELTSSTKTFIAHLLNKKISNKNKLAAELSIYLDAIKNFHIKPINTVLTNLIHHLQNEKTSDYINNMLHIINHIIHPVISMVEELIIFADSTVNPHLYEKIISHIHTWEHLIIEKNDLNIERAFHLGKRLGQKIDTIVRTQERRAMAWLIDEALTRDSWIVRHQIFRQHILACNNDKINSTLK